VNQRLPPSIGQHLYFSPKDAAPADKARAQGLGHRLFSGETGRQLWDPSSTVGYFRFRVNAPQETLAMPLEDLPYAFDLDDVHADGEGSDPFGH
jgi:hypothetical protein